MTVEPLRCTGFNNSIFGPDMSLLSYIFPITVHLPQVVETVGKVTSCCMIAGGGDGEGRRMEHG